MPAGTNKKELLALLDKVPTFVQRLQFTVKDHTVGKAATFTKVDNVIQETKNLMNVISKVVTNCFECATKVSQQFFHCMYNSHAPWAFTAQVLSISTINMSLCALVQNRVP